MTLSKNPYAFSFAAADEAEEKLGYKLPFNKRLKLSVARWIEDRPKDHLAHMKRLDEYRAQIGLPPYYVKNYGKYDLEL